MGNVPDKSYTDESETSMSGSSFQQHLTETRFNDLLFDTEDSDLTLNLQTLGGEVLSVPLHRMVFRRRSPVFKTMLERQYLEGDTGCATIQVQGPMAAAISFIRFLYTEQLETQDLSKCLGLLKTAHMYQMSLLVSLCEGKILSQLDMYNLVDVCIALENICSSSFLSECKFRACRYAFIIFEKDFHIKLSEEIMCLLLDADDLNVIDEEQVLRALWTWGQWRCLLSGISATSVNTKEVIAKLLPKVRWSLITKANARSDYFFLVEENKEIASKKENKDIGKCNTERKSAGLPSLVKQAQKLDSFHTGRVMTSRTTFPNISETLLKFFLTREVFLVALKFQITVHKYPSSWENCVYLYINKMVLNGNVVSKEKLIDFEKNNNVDCYTVQVLVELNKTLLLKTGIQHEITLTKRNSSNLYKNVSFPNYVTPENIPQNDLRRASPFNIIGDEVVALTKIYYF